MDIVAFLCSDKISGYHLPTVHMVWVVKYDRD